MPCAQPTKRAAQRDPLASDTGRRTLLRLSAASLASLASGHLLSACGADRDADEGRPAPSQAGASTEGPPRQASNVAANRGAASPNSSTPSANADEPPTASASATPQAGRDADDAPAVGVGSSRIACAKPTTFPPFEDGGLRTSFRRTQDSTSADWVVIALMVTTQLLSLPDRILNLLRALGELRLGHALSMLDHSLQTATRARRAGASEDLVLAALCHRLGMAFTIEGYAELSASILRGVVTDDVYRIVRHHPEYAQPRSRRADPRARYAGKPWHTDAVRFYDEWVSVSYDPAYDSEPLAAFEELVRARFVPTLDMDPYRTQQDCFRETP